MKQFKLNKGLQLQKESISKLQAEKADNVKGGRASCCMFSCQMNFSGCCQEDKE
ncbi:MAG: class I lanthipeptide [Bacteroidota bacterium]